MTVKVQSDRSRQPSGGSHKTSCCKIPPPGRVRTCEGAGLHLRGDPASVPCSRGVSAHRHSQEDREGRFLVPAVPHKLCLVLFQAGLGFLVRKLSRASRGRLDFSESCLPPWLQALPLISSLRGPQDTDNTAVLITSRGIAAAALSWLKLVTCET